MTLSWHDRCWIPKIEGFGIQTIAESDAYTRLQAAAARCDAKRGLETLDKLDIHYGSRAARGFTGGANRSPHLIARKASIVSKVDFAVRRPSARRVR